MKTKQDLHIITHNGVKIFAFAFFLVMSACESLDESVVEKPGEVQLSDTEIRLEVADWKSLQESRAVLFEGEEDFKDGGTTSAPKPGGHFTVYGYIDGEDASHHTYLGGAHAKWYTYQGRDEWIFVTGNNEEEITYYWPNSDAVNFFAYMPYKGYQPGLKHYVSNFQYSKAEGQTFDCTLPTTNADDAHEIEFIYAYEQDKTKADNPLKFHFKHPFAAVYFKLSPESSRMTVNSIALDNVYLNGTFSCKENEWASSGTPGTFTATINKRIPNDVNYNTIFAGPYLVMPQELSNQVKLILNATRAVEGNDNGTTVSAEASLTGEWEPGKKYIYTLEVGDKNEEIYFSVAVEDWIKVDYKNEINVE